MSGFSIKNMMDVEDSAGQSSEVEARFARKHLDSEHLGVSFFSYGPSFRSQMGHSHREQEEAYVVIAGSGRIKLDDEIVELRQWDIVRVAPMSCERSKAVPTDCSSSLSGPIGPPRATACPCPTGGPTSGARRLGAEPPQHLVGVGAVRVQSALEIVPYTCMTATSTSTVAIPAAPRPARHVRRAR